MATVAGLTGDSFAMWPVTGNFCNVFERFGTLPMPMMAFRDARGQLVRQNDRAKGNWFGGERGGGNCEKEHK
uniref:Uncharacterized protein n=1 Tax=Nelumbo nucifera TaxID=4432 RepID=A0A822ZNY0_NELNU|nr:TPA_asm: hypothetical protein HUJ06_016879 [Nelumbo nucifera]